MITAGLSRAAGRGWSSGASGSGATDGTFGTWRGSKVTIIGTWADRDAASQTAESQLKELAEWDGDIDIAVGGTVLGSSESYAAAARGDYDARWTTMARNLRTYRGNATGVTYVRPFHEFNGNWYTNWQVTPENIEDYHAAWRRIVGILRTEAPNVVIVWSPNNGTSAGSARPEQAYPGDDVIDVIGVDSYDGDGNQVVTSPADWDQYANAGTDTDPVGVERWRQFAERHGKPISFPEWGLKPGAGGGDRPQFITSMNAWMTEHAAHEGEQNLAGKVLYDVYFNVVHQGDAGFTIYGNGANPSSGATYAALRWGAAQTSYAPAPASPAASAPSLAPTPTPTSSSSSPTSPGIQQVALTAQGIDRPAETLADQSYVADGSSAHRLDLYLPKRSAAAGPIPLIAFVHGGAFSSGDKSDVTPFLQPFLDRGYAVASVNYRLSGDALFPAGDQDVKAAVRWLRANARAHGIDPGRVGAFGVSAGGYMASMLGVTVTQQPNTLDDPTLGNPSVSSAVQAVASFYAPSNFVSMNAQAKQSQCVGTPQDHDDAGSPESLWLGSPVQTSSLSAAANLTRWIPTARPGSIPPFMLVHGTADCLVPPGQSQELAAALQQAGGQVTLNLVPGAGHADKAIDQDKLPAVVSFFDRTLAAGVAGAS